VLVRTAIDSDAIADANELGLPTALTLHQDLLRALTAHAVVVFASKDEESRLLREINSLPPALRERWAAALPRVRRQFCAIPIPIEDVTCIEDLRRSYTHAVTLVGCERTRSLVLGLQEDDTSLLDPASGIELSQLFLLSLSGQIAFLQQLTEQDIPADARRDVVWSQRFEPLAMTSRTVTIVDRYAIHDLDRGAGSGLQWFIRSLASTTVESIELMCGDKDLDLDNAVLIVRTALRSLPAMSSINQIKVTIADDRAFYSAHGRYIRFDSGPVLMIEPGFGVFKRLTVGQSFPCPFVSGEGQLDRERRIRAQRRRDATLRRT
jgi:hypothetical protein